MMMVAGRSGRLQALHQFDAVHLGHGDVQQHGVDAAAVQHGQRLGAALGGEGLEKAGFIDDAAHALGQQALVVHHQHGKHAEFLPCQG
jgi:hypothetical protein